MQIKKERAADSPFLFALWEGDSQQRGFFFGLLFCCYLLIMMFLVPLQQERIVLVPTVLVARTRK